MTKTPQLPFSCIKWSKELRQAKRTPRLAKLVIKRPAAATLQLRRHRGARPKALQRQPTVLVGRWLFLPRRRAPCHGPCPWTPPTLCAVLQFGGIVVSLPAGGFRGRGPSPVYKEPVYDLGGDPAFTNSFHNQAATSEEEDGAHSTIVHHSHNCALGKHPCTVNLSKQCNTS
jgi:hypothetical protein